MSAFSKEKHHTEKIHGKTSGLIAAAVTAFRENGMIDVDFVRPMADFLMRQGVSGVFVNGTTGEGLSLTIEERELLAEAWRAALPNGMRLFVHVGALAQGDSVRLAVHASRIGADALAALLPGFFKPASAEDACAWLSPVAEAAPALPFYYYHMPSMNGVSFRVHDFLENYGQCIPNLAGVKFTFESLDDYLLCQQVAQRRYDILWGRDEMLLGALTTGAQAAVGSTYNVAAPVYLRLIEACSKGDLQAAREAQIEACQLIRKLQQGGTFFSNLKLELRRAGLPITGQVRSPLRKAPC